MRLDSIRVSKVEKVQLLDKNGTKQGITGTLYITTTHFMFVTDESSKETWVLHSHVENIERSPMTAAGCPLTIKCKTFQTLNLLILRDKDCQDVFESISEMSQPLNLQDVYAFSYVPSNREVNIKDGWNSMDLISADFTRLGLPNHNWILSDFNAKYLHCDTYPEKVFVPRNVPTQILIGSSKFRSKGRLPVLSYLHTRTQASICRCSQPLTGFSARCMEDEEMMQYILKTNPNSNVLYVVDTRPKINAMANKAAGKGFENESNYANMKFYTFPIENIHVMRNSLQKLVDACSNRNLSVTAFLSVVENSGWLKHIRIILETAGFIADSILKSVNVVVHCSDGWDRTAQAVSLATLLLDPYYRTLKGFQVLIERDWLMFGHKFTDRCGHLKTSSDDFGASSPTGGSGGAMSTSMTGGGAKEAAPIFTQFLDCVWQLGQQQPRAFEFNERFLIALNDNAYSCQFGTFLGNCEKDRRDLRIAEKTYSFWAYANLNRDEFLNTLYCPEKYSSLVTPDVRPQNIKFWRSMYNRFDIGVHPRENLRDLASTMRDRIISLKDHAEILSKKITNFKIQLGRSFDEKWASTSISSQSAMQDSGNFTVDETSCTSLSNELDNNLSKLNVSSNQTNSGIAGTCTKTFSDSESGFEDAPTPGSSISGGGGSGGGTEKTNPFLVTSRQSLFQKTPSMEQRRSGAGGGGAMRQQRSIGRDFFCTSAATDNNANFIDWQKLRDASDCSACNTMFSHCQRKFNCWRCGKVYCRRCVSKSRIDLQSITEIIDLNSSTSNNGVLLEESTPYRLCCRKCSAIKSPT